MKGSELLFVNEKDERERAQEGKQGKKNAKRNERKKDETRKAKRERRDGTSEREGSSRQIQLLDSPPVDSLDLRLCASTNQIEPNLVSYVSSSRRVLVSTKNGRRTHPLSPSTLSRTL